MSRTAFLIAAVIVAACAVAWAFNWTRDVRATTRSIENQQRIKEWAYVARTKALGPSEELSLVIVPSEFGRVFDVRCLVYKNREMNHVTFTCPEARQEQLEEGPAP